MSKINYCDEFRLFEENKPLREFEMEDDKIVLDYNARENDYVVRSCISRRLKFRIFPKLEDANTYFEQLQSSILGDTNE